jgi:hypothetical protein
MDMKILLNIALIPPSLFLPYRIFELTRTGSTKAVTWPESGTVSRRIEYKSIGRDQFEVPWSAAESGAMNVGS